MVAPSSTSECSTIGQHTTSGYYGVELHVFHNNNASSDKSSVGVLRQDWSEDEDDDVEECDNNR